MKLAAALLAIMLAIGAVSYLAYLRSPPPVPCAERQIAQSEAPGGRTEADVFEVNCGGSLATHVALRPAQTPVQARSDVFIAAGSARVALLWNAERELIIESPARRVLVLESSWRNVAVRLRRVR